MEKTYRFLPYYFAVFTVLVIYCFYQSYFGEFPDFEGVVSPIGNVPITITSVTHFHVFMIMAWLLMLIVQPILILKKQLNWHRLLGKISYGLVALMILSFILIVRQEQLREKSLPVFASNLLDPIVFIVMYGLAIYYRKKPAYHARFMVMTIIGFIGPAFARIQGPALETVFALFALFLILEWRTRKIYKPYLISLGYYVTHLGIVAYLFFGNQALLDSLWHFFFEKG
ncbi:hypothetical protein DR864_01620 [Runella rosea]|uniref:Uncharacterized protein n=1 Tax=Runella rosea TaxID=2259595 RepID=A0A344TCZ4_9BACT|nr:hypothetical protein [Runella rosea]AXE16515.1 hypothetical protein DR864_01620 [Runella rosea]